MLLQNAINSIEFIFQRKNIIELFETYEFITISSTNIFCRSWSWWTIFELVKHVVSKRSLI